MIALRGAGASVGWGFQLQGAVDDERAGAPVSSSSGSTFLGVFEFGASAQNVGGGLAGKRRTPALLHRALAVIAADAVHGAVHATAIGVALSQSATTTLLVFAALGLGFALPLTLLHFAPGLQRLMPKPGPWMERVRNVLAFRCSPLRFG